MAKTHKILDMRVGTDKLICICVLNSLTVYDPTYKIYRAVCGSRKLLTKFKTFHTVLDFFERYFIYGVNTMSLPEVREWIKTQTFLTE